MFKKISLSAVLLGLPALSFAQSSTDATSILVRISDLVNMAIPILIALILVWFIWNVVLFVSSEDKRADAKKSMIAGVIGLLVVLSIWGIIGIIQNTFDIGAGGTVTDELIPRVELR